LDKIRIANNKQKKVVEKEPFIYKDDKAIIIKFYAGMKL